MLKLPPPTDDTPSVDDLLTAMDSLAAEQVPRWGTMDSGAMLEHCSSFVDLYLGKVRVGRGVRMIARLIGPMFLKRVIAKSPTATPKNLRTLSEIKTEAGGAADLGPAKERLRAGLEEVRAMDGVQTHVLYGASEAESLRSLVRHHTAHHFHQFGLLD
jgi:hypothetical protein